MAGEQRLAVRLQQPRRSRTARPSALARLGQHADRLVDELDVVVGQPAQDEPAAAWAASVGYCGLFRPTRFAAVKQPVKRLSSPPRPGTSADRAPSVMRVPHDAGGLQRGRDARGE